MGEERGSIIPSAAQMAGLVDELGDRARGAAQAVVPWFAAQMPRSYFQDTDRESQLSHLSALLASRSSGIQLRLTLRTEGGAVWTFIQENDFPALLAGAGINHKEFGVASEGWARYHGYRGSSSWSPAPGMHARCSSPDSSSAGARNAYGQVGAGLAGDQASPVVVRPR